MRLNCRNKTKSSLKPIPLNTLKLQPGGFCWYLCVYSSTRRSYRGGIIQVGSLLWGSLVQLPAQSKATFEGMSVCTTSQVSNGDFSYNLLYFQSFSIHPCEQRTKHRVLSSVPPRPALRRGAGLGRRFAAEGMRVLCPLHRGWSCRVRNCSLGRGDPGTALCCRDAE